jgi:hypothetical protein
MLAGSRQTTAFNQPTDRRASVFQLEAQAGHYAHFLSLLVLSLAVGLTAAWGVFLAWKIVTTSVAVLGHWR